jgi:hypothetical protein
VPFTRDSADAIRYMPFIDKKTGKLYTENTEYYWKPMSRLFFEYINHRESKFDGDVGTLQNKHINITGVDYIGKESNNLERAEITSIEEDDYVYYKKDSTERIVKCLETLTKDEARLIGMSNWQYNYIERCKKQGKVPKLKRKSLRLLGLS